MRFYFDYLNFIDYKKQDVYIEYKDNSIEKFDYIKNLIQTWIETMVMERDVKYFVEWKNQEEYVKLNLDYTLFLLGKN
jgi:hypothetical protein